MSARRLELELARRRLLERSAEVREQLAVQSAALRPILDAGDRVRDAVHWLRTHPALVASAVAVVVVVRPRTAWRWGLRAWAAWQFMRGWNNRLRPLAALAKAY